MTCRICSGGLPRSSRYPWKRTRSASVCGGRSPTTRSTHAAALRLELGYLKEDLAKNAGDRSDRAFRHNAYAVLTACRILYTARYRTIASKGGRVPVGKGVAPGQVAPGARGGKA